MVRQVMQGLFLLILFCAGSVYGECTPRDRQTLRDTGWSEYKIDQLCGPAEDRPEVKARQEVKEEGRVRPQRPNSHGRLQEATNICQTELTWCTLDQEGPPGTPCVCQTSQGPLKGVLVAR